MTEVVPYAAEFGLLAELEQAGAITSTGLRLTEEMPIERWEALGRMLGRTRTATNFAIGDWLSFGESVYGETYAAGMNATGLSYDTLARYASVCRAIPPSRRRPELTFSHHVEVAPLTPAQQKRMLAQAVKQEWTSAELRAEVRALREIEPGSEQLEVGGTAVTSSDNGDAPRRVIEDLRSAARAVYDAAHRDGGEYRVPAEPMARLGAALGEG